MMIGREHPHDDSGLSLVEVLTTVVVMALAVSAASMAIMVFLLNEPRTSAALAETQDLRQLVNFLPADVSTTEAADVRAAAPFVEGWCPPAGTGGTPVLQLQSTDRSTGLVTRTEYRVIRGDEGSSMVRLTCSAPTVAGPFGGVFSDRMADELATLAPVDVEVGPAGRVTVTLSHAGGSTAAVSATAFNRVDLGGSTCPALPFDSLYGFYAVVAGDLELRNGKVLAPLAVGRNLRWSGSAVVDPPTTPPNYPGTTDPTGMYVGGALDFAGSSSTFELKRGFAKIGDLSNANVVPGSTTLIQPKTSGSAEVRVLAEQSAAQTSASPRVDLFGSMVAFGGTSTALADQAVLGCAGSRVVAWPLPITELSLPAGTVTFIDVSAAQLRARTDEIKLTGEGALVINVTDAGAVALRVPNIAEAMANRVIWNVSRASSVSLESELWGSLLSPAAGVSTGKSMHGHVIAPSLILTDGELDRKAAFDPSRWPGGWR
jgi:choice-of-anchor A domain-containing protein